MHNQFLNINTQYRDSHDLTEKEYQFLIDMVKSEHSNLSDDLIKEHIDNDLIVEMMVLYPEQDGVLDALGREVFVNEAQIKATYKAMNELLNEKLKGGVLGVNKLKSWVKGKNADNYDFTTIQINHSTDIDDRKGFSNGYFEIRETNDGMPYLYGKAHIIDPLAKIKLKLGLYRGISATIRNDDTLKEISFVTHPALRDASVLSEPSAKIDNFISKKDKIYLQLSELSDKISTTKESIHRKEKELCINKTVYELINNFKIMPRDKDYYKNMLMSLDGKSLKLVADGFMLSEPVTRAYKNETRNLLFFEGVQMSKDIYQALDEAKKSGRGITKALKEVLSSNPKAKLSETDVNLETGVGDSDDVKKICAKLSAMLSEVKDEELKGKLSALLGEYASPGKDVRTDPNATSGNIPDNAKLSEEVDGLKGKLSEYETQNKKLMQEVRELLDNNKATQKIIKTHFNISDDSNVEGDK